MQQLDAKKIDKKNSYCCSNPNCNKVFSKPKIIKYYVCPTCQTIVDMNSEDSQQIVLERTGFERNKPKSTKLEQREKPKTTSQKLAETREQISAQNLEDKTDNQTSKPTQVEQPNITEKPAKKDERISFQNLEEKTDKQTPKPMQVEEPNIAEKLAKIKELISAHNLGVKTDKQTFMPTQVAVPKSMEPTSTEEISKFSTNHETPFGIKLGDTPLENVKKTDLSSDSKCTHYFGYLNQRNKEEVVPETCFSCLKSVECMLSGFNNSQESVREIKKWYAI